MGPLEPLDSLGRVHRGGHVDAPEPITPSPGPDDPKEDTDPTIVLPVDLYQDGGPGKQRQTKAGPTPVLPSIALDQPPLDLGDIHPLEKHRGTVNPLNYEVGHPIAVRVDGTLTLKWVHSVSSDLRPKFSVAMQSPSGTSWARILSDKEILEENPFKIGHWVRNVPGWGDVRCDGVNAAGELYGTAIQGDSVRTLSRRELLEAAAAYKPLLETQMSPKSPFPEDLIAAAQAIEVAPDVPTVERAHKAYVGGLETCVGNSKSPEVIRLETETCSLAFFTSKGWLYKDFNEDGVIVGTFRTQKPKHEYVYAIVVDQAGGEASVEGEFGMAGTLVNEATLEVMKMLEAGQLTPEETLRELVWRSNEKIIAYTKEMVHTGKLSSRHPGRPLTVAATLGATLIEDGKTSFSVSVGDPMVRHIRDNRIQMTMPRDYARDAWVHGSKDPITDRRNVNAGRNRSSGIFRALGGLLEAPDRALGAKCFLEKARNEQWKEVTVQSELVVTTCELKRGDSKVLGSDGVGGVNEVAQTVASRTEEKPDSPESLWNQGQKTDYELAGQQLEELFEGASRDAPIQPLAATVGWLRYVKRSIVETFRGKPDNASLVVIRVK
jgi:hypothetical protein